MDIGAPELLIVLLIVIVVFGVGRVGKLGGELGSAIREFRRGVGGDKETTAPSEPPAPAPAAIVEAEPAAPANRGDDTATHTGPMAAAS